MYFIYSVVHLSSLFAGGIPINVAGHVTISVFGNSLCIKYFARFIWSSVVMITIRFNCVSDAIFFYRQCVLISGF